MPITLRLELIESLLLSEPFQDHQARDLVSVTRRVHEKQESLSNIHDSSHGWSTFQLGFLPGCIILHEGEEFRLSLANDSELFLEKPGVLKLFQEGLGPLFERVQGFMSNLSKEDSQDGIVGHHIGCTLPDRHDISIPV